MDYVYQFNNRSKEISEIKANFEKSVKNKGQSALLIRGKKGIGKTRLIFEFINEIEKEVVDPWAHP